MPLNNTIILPAGNQNSAQSILASFLVKDDILTVVVFGNDSLAAKVVEETDIRAEGNAAGIARKVVWMQDPDLIPFLNTLINDGPSFEISNIDANSHIGIALSMNHILMDVIPRNPEPDYIRMEMAFINSGN